MERFRKIKQILKKSFSKLILSICVISCCLTIVPFKLIPEKTAVVHADGTPDTYIKNYIGSLIMTYLANMGLTIHSTVNDLGSFVYDLYDTFFRSYSGVLALGELMNEVEYDPDTETVSMKSAGYNSISSFADYLIHEKDITSESIDIILGQSASPAYYLFSSLTKLWTYNGNDGYKSYRWVISSDPAIRFVAFKYNDMIQIHAVSLTSGHLYQSSSQSNGSSLTDTTVNQLNTYNGIQYYSRQLVGVSGSTALRYDIDIDLVNITDTSIGWTDYRYLLAFGDAATLQDNIYVNGDATLDDRIGDISNNETADISLKDIIALLDEADLLDTSFPNADTNEDILKQILTAIQEYADDDDWADALDTTDVIEDPVFKIDPSKIPIPNILDPNAIPLLYEPECETLTACLIQGAQTVSDQLTSFSMLDQNYRKYIVVSVGVAFSLFVMGVWA